MSLGKGKLYFGGTTQDIERLALKFRDKMLSRYEKHMKNKRQEDFHTHEWLKWIVDHLGGSIRYCDPMAYTGKHWCERHGVVTIQAEDDFLVHNSAVMTFMYNNVETATALGFYFLNWDRQTKDVNFTWADEKIAWQARRFGMSMLMPRKEVFDYLENKLNYSRKPICLGNYEWLADHFTGVMAGHFEATSKPVKVRLLSIFKEYAEEKEQGLKEFEQQFMCT